MSCVGEEMSVEENKYFPECCVDVVLYVSDNGKVIINMAGSIL
jgi:hypothetical protein